MDLERLLRPKCIAVVGASPRTFVGQVALENGRAQGYVGGMYPICRHEEVAGFRAFPSLRDVPERVDVALIQVRTDRVLQVVRDGLMAGVRGFVVPGSGFTDSGQAALDLVDDLKKLRADHEFALIGPNCMGALDLVSRAAPYIGTVNEHVRRGSVALVAQSGAVVEAVVNSGGRVPLSTAVSAGNEAITDMAAYLDFFVTDQHTSAVLAFVETLGDATRLKTAIQRLTEVGKPVAICVVGHSETAVEGITAHSGRLAVGARLATAAFKQAGALIASDLDELMAFGELFGVERRLPRGNRLHVVTNSGGEGNLLADLAEPAGLTLPKMSATAQEFLHAKWPTLSVRNPLDPWGTDAYELIYPDAVRQAADEPGEILMIAMDQHRASGEHERKLGKDLARYLSDGVEESPKFPVMLSPLSDDLDPELVDLCRQLRVPLLRGARTGLTALAKLAEWHVCRERPRSQVGVRFRHRVPRVEGVGPFAEDQAMEIVAQLGISTPRRVVTGDPASAAAAAASFDGPVVLKGLADGVTHKTERGLVAISPNDVHDAATRMAGRNPDLELKYLVVEQVRGELEVLVGYKQDPTFGPTVIVGIGGVWAEFHADVSVHVGHLDEASAAALLESSTVGRMFAAARGGALDREGVIGALVAVSELGRANADLLSIEINPLIVGRERSTAVDAVIERRQTQ